MADSQLINMITDLVKVIQDENKEQNKLIRGLAVQVAKLEAFRENMIGNLARVFKSIVRVDAEINDIKKAMPNERETVKAEKEAEEIKKKVSDNSKDLLKIFSYVAGVIAAFGAVVSLLKWTGKI